MNYNEFIKGVYQAFMSHTGNQRYGQFMVNYISEHYPEISIPKKIDPYYDNDKIPDLMNYLSDLYLT